MKPFVTFETILRLLSGFRNSLDDDDEFRLFWKELGECFLSFENKEDR